MVEPHGRFWPVWRWVHYYPRLDYCIRAYVPLPGRYSFRIVIFQDTKLHVFDSRHTDVRVPYCFLSYLFSWLFSYCSWLSRHGLENSSSGKHPESQVWGTSRGLVPLSEQNEMTRVLTACGYRTMWRGKRKQAENIRMCTYSGRSPKKERCGCPCHSNDQCGTTVLRRVSSWGDNSREEKGKTVSVPWPIELGAGVSSDVCPKPITVATGDHWYENPTRLQLLWEFALLHIHCLRSRSRLHWLQPIHEGLNSKESHACDGFHKPLWYFPVCRSEFCRKRVCILPFATLEYFRFYTRRQLSNMRSTNLRRMTVLGSHPANLP